MNVTTGYTIITGMFLFLGFIWIKFPPKSMDSGAGFRTKKASRSQQNWDIAQRLCGQYMVGIGLFCGVFFTAIILLNKNLNLSIQVLEYLSVVPVVMLVSSIFLINKRLPD